MSQKKYKKNNLPVKVLNENINFIFCILSEYKVKFFGKSQNIAKFADCLKLATITSVFKKRGTFQKEQLLTGEYTVYHLKKIRAKTCSQIWTSFDDALSKFQRGFGKGYDAKHCLLTERNCEKKQSFWHFISRSVKRFWLSSHDLLTTKLYIHGFGLPSLKLLPAVCQQQGTKVDCKVSLWKKILYGVPQGPILDSTLLIILLCDMF